VTRNLLPYIRTCYRLAVLQWHETFYRLPGLAKNAAPRRRRHLIKPPGR
jgi:hypothetical protein